MENTSANRKTTRDYKEMLLLKGIGSELEKMAYPKVSNLRAMLETLGYTIVPYTYSKPEVETETEEEVKSNYKY
jgi:hypothetical protein